MSVVESSKLQELIYGKGLSRAMAFGRLNQVLQKKCRTNFAAIEWAIPHALKAYQTLGDQEACVQLLFSAFGGCQMESRPSDGLGYLRQAESTVDPKDFNSLVRIHSARSIAQASIGETYIGIVESELALKYSREASSNRMVLAMCNSGCMYAELNETNAAIKIFEQAIQYGEQNIELTNTPSAGSGDLALGTLLNHVSEQEHEENNIQVANELAKRAYKLNKKAHLLAKGEHVYSRKATAMYEAIRSLINLGDFERAIKMCEFYKKNYVSKNTPSNYFTSVMFSDLLGTILLKSGNTKQALIHLINSYDITKSSQPYSVNERLLRLIVDGYDHLHDTKNALKWNKKHSALKALLNQQREAYTATKEKQPKENKISRIGTIEFLLHDLRSPITSQLALLEGIKPVQGTVQLDEAQAKEVKQLALRSLFMTQEYLTYERLNGAKGINLIKSSIQDILDNTYNSMHASCKLAGIKLENSILSEDIQAYVDPVLLEKALISLINNSINASNPGTVISVNGCVNSQLLYLTVADQGSGIPDEIKQSLFMPNANLQSRSGYGLGFALVRRVAELHKGFVEINNLQIGTKISLVFPVDTLEQ